MCVLTLSKYHPVYIYFIIVTKKIYTPFYTSIYNIKKIDLFVSILINANKTVDKRLRTCTGYTSGYPVGGRRDGGRQACYEVMDPKTVPS